MWTPDAAEAQPLAAEPLDVASALDEPIPMIHIPEMPTSVATPLAPQTGPGSAPK